MPKTSVPQKVYRVTLSKTFEYHSAVIDEGNFLSDLHAKAVDDFVSKLGSSSARPSDFDCKLEAELPFRVRLARNTEKDPKNVRVQNVDLDFMIQEIALELIEKKYGKLNWKENPKVFVQLNSTSESRNAYEESNYRTSNFYLKPEIEEELNQSIENLLDTMRRRVL